MLGENTPFYFPSNGQDWPMYLTSATLVVVPDDMLLQWNDEIMMHCSTPLRVLFLTTDVKAPSVKTLATDFDVG